jgi:hypothetical protein
MKHFILVIALLLSTHLARSASIGAVVQSVDYDATKGVTTVHILNTSHKEISALTLSLRVTFPDGTVSAPGASVFGLDFLEGIIQGKGGFAPGAIHSQEFPGQAGPVQATVDMVAYADGTADVTNELAFKTLIANRKAKVRALQKVDELLNNALADPAEKHPSARVAAELGALLTATDQQKTTEEGAANYEAELKGAIQDLNNKPQSPLGRSDLEDNTLRALIKTHRDRIAVTMRHTELVKAVQP